MSNPIDKQALYDQMLKLLDAVEKIQPAPNAPPPEITLTDQERTLAQKLHTPEEKLLEYKRQRQARK